MQNYFTLHNLRKVFSVVIVDKHVSVFRIENECKIWDGIVKNTFIGKNCLNEMTEYSGARDDVRWDGNSFF